ncbi:MAG: NAD-dependent epimerase/dehydratase family protein [Chloroflexi bacterium]|nr:NAD-dependent epimerase/dehydratase family protein [Chloroflexota bacterium]
MYLVTGGAGFIGASLVRALEARGDRVRVLDSGRAAGARYLTGTAAEIVPADIAEPGIAAAAVKGVDAIVHLAARTSVPASMEAPLADLRDNVLAAVTVLDAARVEGVQRFVFASSNATVGLMAPPAREDILPRPVSPYGAAKLAFEGYLQAYHHGYGMTTTALRFSNAYGPYSLHKGSVVATFIRECLEGRPLVIHGDGDQTRDLVHVDDLVALMLLALDAPAGLVGGEVFQAGTGKETTVRELAETVLELCGGGGRIEHLPARRGDVLRNVSAISKARDMLGYMPRVELRQGLAQTVAWFREALRDAAPGEASAPAGDPDRGSDAASGSDAVSGSD